MFEKWKIRNSQASLRTAEGVLPLREIEPAQLPEDIFGYVMTDLKHTDFRTFVVPFGGRWKTYVLEQKGGASADDPIETFFLDYSGEEYAGYTKISAGTYKSLAGEEVSVASVAGTYTRNDTALDANGPDYSRLGLATRRLLAANKYCLDRYHAPLSSGTIVDDSARAVWNKLVTDGLAEQVRQSDMGTYRFKI